MIDKSSDVMCKRGKNVKFTKNDQNNNVVTFTKQRQDNLKLIVTIQFQSISVKNMTF